MAGEWDKIEGEVKEGAGKLTGDKSTEVEGEAQGTWGEAQDGFDDAKDKVGERLDEGSDEARERI